MIDFIKFNTGAAAGGAGVATSTGNSPHISGEIIAVALEYLDTPPAGTCDFTLSDEGDPQSEAIISRPNSATDIKIYPRRILEQADGTDLLYAAAGEEVYGRFVVHGRLEAVIAQANNGDSVNVFVWFER
jgi:hypothetical protein